MKKDLGWWGVAIASGSMIVLALVTTIALAVSLSLFFLVFLFPLLGLIFITVDALSDERED